ncbi:MAG: hypothetical protein WBI07_04645 [Mobilitalea sp.]
MGKLSSDQWSSLENDLKKKTGPTSSATGAMKEMHHLIVKVVVEALKLYDHKQHHEE